LGFHPKPKMTFSPALPLGWASLGELLDICLEDVLEPGEALLERLNRSSPEGIEFLKAVKLLGEDPPLSRLLHAAEYAVELCLAAESPGPYPTNNPGPHPTNHPESHPTNHPESHPTNYPESHPTNYPGGDAHDLDLVSERLEWIRSGKAVEIRRTKYPK